MNLKPFLKKTVMPGEPLTAQAWNDVLDAIDGAYLFLQSSLHTIRVTITNLELDPEEVRVTATSSSAPPVEAVRPTVPTIAPAVSADVAAVARLTRTHAPHILSRLDAGAWTVTAQARGYLPATAAVNITTSGETALELALQKAGTFMPDLFGARLGDAKAALNQANLALFQLVDFNGRDLPKTTPENDDRLVLVQWPAPGSPMEAGGNARLVVAVPVQAEPAVIVPTLTTLTLQEAQTTLDAIGLNLGKVTVLHRTATT